MRSHEAKERFRRARQLYIDRQFAESLAILDELKDVYDAYPDLHYLRARCLGKLKRAEELRAVADLLTTRFADPRGEEILTWFVRRPAPELETPAPAPGDVPTAEPAPAATAEELAEAPLLAEPAELAQGGMNEAVQSPGTPQEQLKHGPDASEEAAGSTVRIRAWGRRAAVAAVAAMLLGVLGAALTSNVASTRYNPPAVPPRSEPQVALAALKPATPVEAPREETVVPAPSNQHATRGDSYAVTFRPDTLGGYAVEPALKAPEPIGPGTELDSDNQVRTSPVPAWKVALPFRFSFGGIEWESVFVNRNGNLTFGYAEADVWTEREPSETSTIGSVAAAVDARAAAGRERMIAPLWFDRDSGTVDVLVREEPDRLTVSWLDLEPSEQIASAVLHADGRIAFQYHDVAQAKAFAGVFPGIAWAGERIAYAEDGEDVDDPNVDIIAVEVVDAPTVVQFAFTMRTAVPSMVSSGELVHRITLDTAEGPRQFGVSVTNGPRGWVDWGAAPNTLGYERDGNRLYLYLAKSALSGFGECTAHAEVDWRGHDGLYDRVEDPPSVDFSRVPQAALVGFNQPDEARLGSIYRVFD